MLQSLEDLETRTLVTPDGFEGRLKDLLLDDRDWSVRHLVVQVRKPPHWRRILLSPALAWPAERNRSELHTAFDGQELLACPDLKEDPPVSRQKHIDLVTRDRSTGTRIPVKLLGGDAALRSADQLLGYDVYSAGRRAGRISGFVFDTGDWSTRYLIVSVGILLWTREVLLPVGEIERVLYQSGSLEVIPGVTRVGDLPRFDGTDRIEEQPRDRGGD
jgi:hypothetical protein